MRTSNINYNINFYDQTLVQELSPTNKSRIFGTKLSQHNVNVFLNMAGHIKHCDIDECEGKRFR